jgi:polygalacturonase
MQILGGARDVRIEDCLFDESFGTGSNSLEMYSCSDVSIRGCRMHNGPGTGILMDTSGGYPSRVTIEDFQIEPFSSNPVNTIRINGGTGIRLINVVTNPGAGGDILDNGSDTVWLNVNGKYKMPSLPSADPGAGSKQLWYDAADSNRVKFAP